MSYWITDYITKPSIEEKILGKVLSKKKSLEAKVLLVWHQEVNKEFLYKFPHLIGVVRYGVGYDNIDLKAIKQRNIFFCNNPDYGVDEVSDTTIAMVMNLIRGIHSYNSIAKVLKKEWQQQTLKTIKRTSKYSVGVIGAGRIGSSVLLKLNSLRFKTGFYDPYVYSGYEKTLNARRFTNLNDLLITSDIVSLHCPLDSDTVSMVDENFINNMKQGAFLVNTARGGLVKDNKILAQAITEKKLGGLALDTLKTEPPKKGDPLIDLWLSDSVDSQRIIINPHTAYYSKHSFNEMRTSAANKVRDLLQGRQPRDAIITPND